MISNSSILQPCLQVYAEVYPLAKNAFMVSFRMYATSGCG